MNKLTHDELLLLTRYDPETGIMYWNKRDDNSRTGKIWNTRWSGKPIGSSSSGRLETSIRKEKFLVHRLIWFYVHNEWPDVIDHIDGNPMNNQIINLRNVDVNANMKNMKRFKTNKSGVTGVSWCKRTEKWRVEIWHRNIHKYVGLYSEFNDAVISRKKVEVEHEYHENHGKG